MKNIQKVEKFLKEALVSPQTDNEDFDIDEFETRLVEIELSVADFYPETPYYVYLMALITKIKERYGIDEENIDEDFIIPDEDFVIDFPEEEFSVEDEAFLNEDDHCLDYLFEEE